MGRSELLGLLDKDRRFVSTGLVAAICLLGGLLVAVRPVVAIGLGLAGIYVATSLASPRLAVASWLIPLCCLPAWLGVYAAGGFLEAAALVSIGAIPALFKFRDKFRALPIDFLVLLFLVIAAISTFWLGSPVTFFRQTMLLGGIPYLIGRVISLSAGIDWVYRLFILLMGFFAIWAIVEFGFDFHPFQTLYLQSPLEFWSEIQYRGGLARSEATFGHAIALGACLAMAIPLTLGSSLGSANRAILASLLGLGTLLTFSRGPLLAAFFGFALFVLVGTKGRSGRERAVALITLCALSAVFILVIAPIISSSSEATVSANYRSNLNDILIPTVEWLGPAGSFSFTSGGSAVAGGFISIDSTFLFLGLLYGWIAVSCILVGLLSNALSVAIGRSSPAGISLLALLPVFFTVSLITQFQSMAWFVAGLAAAAYQSASAQR